jgi:hypothetical protein
VTKGLLVHGKRLVIYRHFDNIRKGFNVAAHAWLSELDKEVRGSNKKLPDILYHQIDGGAENATAYTIALAELIIHRGLTKKIVLTRLPVGHTHEDIDSKFAILWVHNRQRTIGSPQCQREESLRAFRKDATSMQYAWKDVLAVPDYESYLKVFSLYLNAHYALSSVRYLFIIHLFEMLSASNGRNFQSIQKEQRWNRLDSATDYL